MTHPGCEDSSGVAAAPEQNPDWQFQIKTAPVDKWELTLVDLLSSLSGCDTTVRKEVFVVWKKWLTCYCFLLNVQPKPSACQGCYMYICEVAIHRHCKLRLYSYQIGHRDAQSLYNCQTVAVCHTVFYVALVSDWGHWFVASAQRWWI